MQRPVAGRLLSFMSYLDPEDIFLELFRHESDSLAIESEDEDRGKWWSDMLSPETSFKDILDEALEALSTYSFIEWKEEQGGYSMHKLVHA